MHNNSKKSKISYTSLNNKKINLQVFNDINVKINDRFYNLML